MQRRLKVWLLKRAIAFCRWMHQLAIAHGVDRLSQWPEIEKILRAKLNQLEPPPLDPESKAFLKALGIEEE